MNNIQNLKIELIQIEKSNGGFILRGKLFCRVFGGLISDHTSTIEEQREILEKFYNKVIDSHYINSVDNNNKMIYSSSIKVLQKLEEKIN